jgi:hypothetical protein
MILALGIPSAAQFRWLVLIMRGQEALVGSGSARERLLCRFVFGDQSTVAVRIGAGLTSAKFAAYSRGSATGWAPNGHGILGVRVLGFHWRQDDNAPKTIPSDVHYRTVRC